MKLGGLEGGRGPGRSWGKGKNMTKMHPMKFSKKLIKQRFFKKKVLYPQLKIINNKEIKIADEAVKGILIIPQISECSMIL